MKTVFYPILALALLCLYPGTGKAEVSAPEDTVTIQIGKSKKIIIWVDDKQDLVSLQLYDINKMIRELNQTVDSLGDANQVLIITDENGEQYKVEELEADTSDIDDDWYKHDRDSSQHESVKLGVHFNRQDYKHSGSRHFKTRHHFEFDLGMNNYLDSRNEFPGNNNEQYTVRPWGSWFAGINSNFRTRIAGPVALQWGGGISWYNFKFEDHRTRLLKSPEELQFVRDASADINAHKSKLTATYLNLNLVPMLDFRYRTRRVRDDDGQTRVVRNYKSDAFRIGLGGYAGYRISSYAKYKYDDGTTRKDRDHNSFYMNNLRYGVRLQLGFKGVDLFANYDLNNLFSANRAPELNAISFGITL